MTKRAVIITTSVLVGLVSIFTILFGVVFRIREINVVCGEDFCYKTQVGDIVNTSKLQKNDSIFSINRNKIADNIEKAYPYARVDGVNITSFTDVNIKLSNREPLYYVVEEAVYYILDEDCKVLEITNDSVRASKYIRLNDVFSMGENVQVGNFLEGSYAEVCNGLYTAMYTNAMLNIGEDADQDGDLDAKYLERADMCEVISSVRFEQVEELHGKVDRLIITTSYGVSLSIIEPTNNLDYKINMVFSALRTLIEQDNENLTDNATKGSIVVRYSYDDNNQQLLKCEYHAE